MKKKPEIYDGGNEPTLFNSKRSEVKALRHD